MILSAFFFLLYIAVAIAIGVMASRKETEEGFMIADRKVHGMRLAATLSAGFFDGSSLAIYLAYVYQFGLSAIWLFIGFGVGFLVLRAFARRIKEKADALHAYSMSEYFSHVIGKKSGYLFSVILILAFFLFLVINLIVSGKVLSMIFPIPYPFAVCIGGAIILTYLLLAGFKAVVSTDVFQLLIMLILSVSVGVYLLGHAPIAAADINLTGLGAGNIVSFLIIGILTAIVGPDIWQRMFAARDVPTLRKGLTYAAAILPLVALIVSVIGLATKQMFPHIVPEDALVTGVSQMLPPGLKEFGMVLLYAVSLSSSDTTTFVVSSIFTRDLQNSSRRFSAQSMRTLTRFFMIAFVVLGILLGIFYQDILTIALSLVGMGIALCPAIFGSFYWKLDDRAVAASLILALASVLILFVMHALTPETSLISLPVSLIALLILQPVMRWRTKMI